jgi:hypothetical protein
MNGNAKGKKMEERLRKKKGWAENRTKSRESLSKQNCARSGDERKTKGAENVRNEIDERKNIMNNSNLGNPLKRMNVAYEPSELVFT